MTSKIVRDEDLINLIHKEDGIAYHILLSRYVAYSRAILNDFIVQWSVPKWLFADLLSLAPSVFDCCVSKYSPGTNNFYVYFKTAFIREIRKEYLKINEMQKMCEESLDDYSDYGNSMSDLIGFSDPLIKGNIDLEDMIHEIKSGKAKLTPIELKILDYKLSGDMETKEIAKKLKLTVSSINKYLTRMKAKIIKYLEQND